MSEKLEGKDVNETTIEDMWNTFMDRSSRPGSSIEDIEDNKQAFFAGASCVMFLISSAQEMPTEDLFLERINSIDTEMAEFVEMFQKVEDLYDKGLVSSMGA